MTLDALIDRFDYEIEAPAVHSMDEAVLDIDDEPTEVELMVLLSGMVGDPGARATF
ncbi:MAG: hypothetical protein K2X67_20315 [Burkholderiales bacterium]|jgi:hypothetical protein|nr:hypothetical protein [Burkholderiales bacterium]